MEPQPLRFVGDTPYLGSTPIGPRRFYTELGRDDLIEQLASNRSRRTMLLLGGAVLFGIGNVVGYLGYYVWLGEQVVDIYQRDLFTPVGSPLIVTGIGIGVAGLIVAVIGYLQNPRPLSPAQERELLAEHNQRAATARRPTPAASPAVTGVSLLPLLLPDGGGAALTLRF